MIVFRLEHPENFCGPYANQCQKILDKHNADLKSKPSWTDEYFWDMVDSLDQYYACCNSLESLFSWFDWFEDFYDEVKDYIICQYDVDEEFLIQDKKGLQAIFKRNESKLISSIPVSDWI